MARTWTRPSLRLALLLAVLLVLSLSAPADAKKGGSRGKSQTAFEREMQERRLECDRSIRQAVPPSKCLDEAIVLENCVLRCISSTCYHQVYGDDPLESGEVDSQRSRNFRTCARADFKGLKD
mmetsp:Transcript_31198/g.101743  ORF Transcript_31198/g.101743 Transcript_31198/m.101743 type:complete len:123 (-) Transcript_31198:41-409(-)